MLTSEFTVHAIAPAILPSLVGRDVVALKDSICQKLSQALEESTKVITGTLGIIPNEFNLYNDALDAGADFRNYYAVRIELPFETDLVSYQSESGFSVRQIGKTSISLFNEAIAIVTVEFSIDVDNALLLQVRERSEFDRFFVNAVRRHVEDALGKLDDKIKQTVFPNPISRSEGRDYLASEIVTPKVAWVHKIFEIDCSDANAVKTDHRYGILIAEHVREAFDGKRSEFSWGDSIHIAHTYSIQTILTACVIMQYHYFVLDRYNRRLPYAITSVAKSGNEMSERVKQRLGMQMRHKLVMQDLTYCDLIQSVAGPLRVPMMGYHESWRFDELRQNVQLKLPVLQDLIADIQNKHQARSNSIVELMLFGVSLLSLVGLFIATHDYVVKPSKDKTTTTQVLVSMLPNKIDDILSFSILLSMLGLFTLGLVRFKLVKKLVSLFG